MITPALDSLISFSPEPLAVKGIATVGGVRTATLEGPLVLFTSPDDTDAEGDYFDATTDYGVLSDLGEVVLPAYYHHGLDETIGRKRLGSAKATLTDAHIWAEYQLSLRSEYEEQILALAEAGKLGQSSGAVWHLIDAVPVKSGAGTVRHITEWPLGEASLTPTPAEIRTGVVPLKSLLASTKADAPTLYEQVVRWLGFDPGIDEDEARTAIKAALADLPLLHELQALNAALDALHA